MSSPHAIRFLVFSGLLGLVAAFLFFQIQHLRDRQLVVDSSESPEVAPLHDPVPEKKQLPEPGDIEIEYPAGALKGELIIRFSTRAGYLDYLASLREMDEKTLGRIDELMVVRISEEVFRRSGPGEFGGRPDFSLRVGRPRSPAEFDPETLAVLRPYGRFAQEIVGGIPHGDGSGIIVGIIDSGIHVHPQFDNIDMVHLDLTGRGIGGPGAAHGTSVASIISGARGISPGAELFVVRVLDDAGLGNNFHVAKGIVEAVDLGAGVINMSLGIYADSALLRDAVRYAADRGVLMVAAAGNDGFKGMPFPAAYSDVLAVTAVDSRGRQAIFPNHSEEIDFAAPGVGVRAASEDQGIGLFTGTSAAAPFITGTLASLMSGEKALDPAAAVDVLRRHLNDAGAPGPDPEYGAGALDWQRLKERETTDILDLALADIHLDPGAQPGTSMPVEVTVQNRGTRWFNEAKLEVMVGGGDPIPFSIGVLGPGQITTRKVYAQVPSRRSADPLRLQARVLPDDLNEDIRPENNFKVVQFRPRSDF